MQDVQCNNSSQIRIEYKFIYILWVQTENVENVINTNVVSSTNTNVNSKF
jgi:hypothetical protein